VEEKQRSAVLLILCGCMAVLQMEQVEQWQGQGHGQEQRGSSTIEFPPM